MLIAIAIASVAAALLLVELLAEWRDRVRYPAPGKYLQIGDRRLHVWEQGQGATVILESGLAASSLSWILVQPLLRHHARVIAYDRGGLGFSSATCLPLTLDGLLRDAETLLGPSPAILVGHSFGGLLVRALAHLHGDRVLGLVLVDPISLSKYAIHSLSEMQRMALAIRLSQRGGWLARFGVVRVSLSLVARGIRGLPMLVGKLSAGKGSSVMNRLASEIAKLPVETHGPIRAYWSRPGGFQMMASYLKLVPEASLQAQSMQVPEHIPIIVLSAATATADELRERDEWTSRNPASRHMQIPNTTHWIQLDRPDVVADAVKELIALSIK